VTDTQESDRHAIESTGAKERQQGLVLESEAVEAYQESEAVEAYHGAARGVSREWCGTGVSSKSFGTDVSRKSCGTGVSSKWCGKGVSRKWCAQASKPLAQGEALTKKRCRNCDALAGRPSSDGTV